MAAADRPTLQAGSEGTSVRELQALLRLLGYYNGPVDGLYRDSTATAVTAFQQAAGLPADGVVGSATWNRLLPAASSVSASRDSASTPTAAASPAAPPTVTPEIAASDAATPANAEVTSDAAPTVVDFPVLRRGMNGSAVMRLQERLQAIGFFDGAVDGTFGEETEAAVIAAQESFELEADGVVGPETWSVLLQ
jgi:peptidoglycan hydrolase-like protein with peptidoglycan-binding domain